MTDRLKGDLRYLVGNQDGCFGDREVIYGEVAKQALDRITQLEAEVEKLTGKVTNLQFLLARYGDRVRMANAIVPHWQSEIDEALAGRCSRCGGTHPSVHGCHGPETPARAALHQGDRKP